MPFPTQPVIATFDTDQNPLSDPALTAFSNIKALGGVARAITTGGFSATAAQPMATEDGEIYLTIHTKPAIGQRVILVARNDGVNNALFLLVTNDDDSGLTVALVTQISGSFATVNHVGQIWIGDDVVGLLMAAGTIDTYWNGTLIMHDLGVGVRGAGSLGFATDEETPLLDNFGGGPLSAGAGITLAQVERGRTVARGVMRGIARVITTTWQRHGSGLVVPARQY